VSFKDVADFNDGLIVAKDRLLEMRIDFIGDGHNVLQYLAEVNAR
jgi:hypothetical protein